MLRQLSNMLKSSKYESFFWKFKSIFELTLKENIYSKPSINMLSASEESQIKET